MDHVVVAQSKPVWPRWLPSEARFGVYILTVVNEPSKMVCFRELATFAVEADALEFCLVRVDGGGEQDIDTLLVLRDNATRRILKTLRSAHRRMWGIEPIQDLWHDDGTTVWTEDGE